MSSTGSLDKKKPLGIASNPPTGKKKVTNLYWDSVTQEIVIDKEE